MLQSVHSNLSRRERQIMDVLFQKGQATAADIMRNIPEPPSYSAVRAMLRVLEEKGHVRHVQDGPRYVFIPTVTRDKAKRSAMKHMLDTFFEGSAAQAVATLLDDSGAKLSDDELERLSSLIDKARKEGA